MSENFQKPHSLSLDNRKKLSLTGVEDVPGFNEETVNAVTSLGTLVIRGFALQIDKLDLDTGEVEISGNINSVQYTDTKRNKSFMQRLLS